MRGLIVRKEETGMVRIVTNATSQVAARSARLRPGPLQAAGTLGWPWRFRLPYLSRAVRMFDSHCSAPAAERASRGTGRAASQTVHLALDAKSRGGSGQPRSLR